MKHGYASGGAAYVISRPGVRRIVEAGPKFPADCPKDGGSEDVIIGRCSCTSDMVNYRFGGYHRQRKFDPCKIVTAENIILKLCTRDYVGKFRFQSVQWGLLPK